MSNLGWFTPSDKLGIPDLWTPAMIETELWIDAADLATITLNGSVVTQIADKSGNARHAVAPSGQEPTLVNAELNSLPVLRFDGSNDVLRGTNGASLDSYIWIVARVRSHASWARIFVMRDTTTDATSFAVAVDSGDMLVGRTSTTSGRGFYRAASSSVWGAYECRHPNAGAGSETLRKTGVVVPSNNTEHSQLISGNLVTSSYSVGARWDESYCAVDIAEIVIVPNTDNRSKLEGYLAHKWGFAKDASSLTVASISAPSEQLMFVDGSHLQDEDGDIKYVL